MSDDIFKRALGIGSYEADVRGGGSVERMRQGYFARFEPCFVDNMSLGCQHQPNWLDSRRCSIRGAIIGIGKKILSSSGGFFALDFGFDMLEKRSRGFKDLRRIE